MYPQTVVPLTSDIHNHLRDNHESETEGVKLLDGVYYTANIDGQSTWIPDDVNTWEKNPVYQYGSDRYVRVTPYAYQDSAIYKYNATADNPNPERVDKFTWNGSSSEPDRLRWFKIEPIKWIILNANEITISETSAKYHGEILTDYPRTIVEPQGATLELYAADVLMSGIPFGGPTWNSERTMYKYLNTQFYNQAFSGTDKSLIQNSTIYNNNDYNDMNDPAYNLNSNHLTDGSGMNPTSQKIYMLSYYELTDAASPYVKEGNKIFGAGDTTTGEASGRQVFGTDYARAHYLMLGTSAGKSYAYYWTRSASYVSTVYCVSDSGGLAIYGPSAAHPGQRPALQLK